MTSSDDPTQSDDGAAYEKAKIIASQGDTEARRKLAADRSAPTEILYYLASDESMPVRKAVAANVTAPVQADFLLSNDTEVSIRMDLASKVGMRLGDLDAETDAAIYGQVRKVLENLVIDQLHTVRAIVAEEIKRLEHVPKGVISKLARDVETAVSTPILEHSPLLEDTELIEIITAGVRGDALAAIARRSDIGSDVSHSIMESGNVDAVATLLENQSAKVSGDTISEIAELAAENEILHRPLAGREDLSETVLRRMAGFVGSAIVEDLIDRYPLNKAAQSALRSAVSTRIETIDVASIREPANRPERYKILLAEDDSAMRGMIRHIIESFLSVDITAVENGNLALHQISSGEKFDLIMCDWMMPEMTGIEFLRALRAMGNETPFVMLTARTDVDSIVAAQNDGVDAFLAKPVTADEIQSKLRMLLRNT